MANDDQQLMELAKEFILLQQLLLAAWREANNSSHDLEMLLDFPKLSFLQVQKDSWAATKHGIGVRFERGDGLTVDVPFGVDQPLAVDANRLFDFLVSKPPLDFGLLPRERRAFYAVVDRLCRSGNTVGEATASGRGIFKIRPAEQG